MKTLNSWLAAVAIAASLSLVACGETTYIFEDVDVGDDNEGRTPRERSDAQFIRAVYADLIGRSTQTQEVTIRIGQQSFVLPFDEQAVLEQVLAGLGDSRSLRAILIAGLVDHEEANIPTKSEVSDPSAFVSEQFRRFLGREPSAYELEAFVADWDSDDSVHPKTVIRALLGSREYQSL